ncbi:class I SAM-dependent methyltransferase [Paenibacillus beijingensis]|uniref:SAM-dependent methyltransferase n=1 Tax=Paenibacillus beijingensis TaxID=1126833 RepID=A0A0D5NP37_9BACL|nr:class I SAM-dependent methyltransferase [Paenibacillus beijingensis]AJY77089.1 SAM-dependent methyltransferase [Paenibacillus beijingensis]
MIVTTTEKPSASARLKAAELAGELGGKLVERRNRTLKQLSERYSDAELLVVTSGELRYYREASETPLYFHPSMAYVRVKRLRKGERDPLVELSGCRPGDSVLDCTAGLGSDAVVFSYAAGPEGAVTALESEPVLCAVVREGLKSYRTELPDVNEALRRIEMVCADHASYLTSLPDNSFDIVYFDPMFRQPVTESSALEPLRALANHEALSPETIAQAVRVARKKVVIKEKNNSPEFERLGFERCPVKKTSAVGYGVIMIEPKQCKQPT